MADFQPLSALRFDPAVAGEPSALIAPPYDVVSAAQVAELYDRSPFNIAHVDNGEQRPGDSEAANRYTRAAGMLDAWRRAGVLALDAAPAMYVYDQEFELDGNRRRRRAVFGRLRLEEWEKGIILPHEYTGAEAKQDRLNLLRATHVHLSPVLALYESGLSLNDADLGPPVFDAVLSGERDTIRTLSTGAADRFQSFLSDRRLYIADGHHRYETALNYRNEVRDRRPDWTGDEPENFTLAALVAADDPDLVVLPTHRLLQFQPASDAVLRLGRHFEIKDYGAAAELGALGRLTRDLAAAGKTGNAFGAVGLEPGRLHLLVARDRSVIDECVPADHAEPWRGLDVNILEHAVYPDIGYDPSPATIAYTEDANEAAHAVERGDYSLALLLNPTPVDQVIACSDAGERMPRKSTFFFPKLATGLVMYPVD